MNKSPRSFRGDRLRISRERLNRTQEELEKLLGFGKGSISRYENGETDPLPNQLVEMSRKLGVSVDWLLGLTDDPEQASKRKDLTPEENLLLEKFRSGELVALAYELLGDALTLPAPTPPTKGPRSNAA